MFMEDNKIDLVIAEVKRGPCMLNGPWTDPERENLQRLLQAVGVLPIDCVDAAARSLYENECFENDVCTIRMISIGRSTNSEPGSPVFQLLWREDVLSFIYQRFTTRSGTKSDHCHWDDVGRELFDLAMSTGSFESFWQETGIEMGLDLA